MRLPQLQVSRILLKVGTVSARTMAQKSAMMTRAQRAQHKSRMRQSPMIDADTSRCGTYPFRAGLITFPSRTAAVNDR